MNDAPAPDGASILFTPHMLIRDIGSGWRSSDWAGGTYSGRIYRPFDGASHEILMTLTDPASAFYFYAAANRYGTVVINATAQDGTTSGDQEVHVGELSDPQPTGRFFGFHGTDGDRIESVLVRIPHPEDNYPAVGNFGGAAPGCDLAASNVGCWHFDEDAGTTAADSSGFANHGTLVNGPLLGVPGVQDTAISMDGKNDHVRVPDSSSLDVGDSFTLEGWIKRDTSNRTHQLFNKGGKGFHLVTMSHYDGNQVWLRKAGSATIARTSGGVPADGEFHHVVAAKDGSNVDLYIDGVEQAVPGTPKTIEDTSFPLYFSATPSGNVVDGALDEYAVYDESLTPAEVAQRAGTASSSTTTSSETTTSSSSRTTTSTAASEHSGSCPSVGSNRSGLTAIRVQRLSCDDATDAARRGPKDLSERGLDCSIISEFFGGPVVRITRTCTGPNGQTLRYTTLS